MAKQKSSAASLSKVSGQDGKPSAPAMLPAGCIQTTYSACGNQSEISLLPAKESSSRKLPQPVAEFLILPTVATASLAGGYNSNLHNLGFPESRFIRQLHTANQISESRFLDKWGCHAND